MLPTLTEGEFEDAFLHVASCYDFHIPPRVLKGSTGKVRLVVYDPCLTKGFEKVMQGLTLELSPVSYFPNLCVESSIVGGTFLPEMRCSTLGHQIGTDKYSLVDSSLWYLLLREADNDAEQKGP